jgi:F-type H+-transporting ATPase subunit a
MTYAALRSISSVPKSPPWRTSFRWLLRGGLLLVFAWAVWVAGPAWADADRDRSGKPIGESSHPHQTQAEPVHTGSPAGHAHEPDAQEHVTDSKQWHFFDFLSLPLPPPILGFQITKFMILELIAAGLILAIYLPLARRLQNGDPARGWRDNAFEVLLTFIRDEVAKPSIGEHHADQYVPFLWTMFLFILFNNLLGIIPFGASATASINVTGALALCVFFAIHGCAIARMGLGRYVQSLWPHIDVPYGLGYVLKPMIFIIEIIGVLVRNAVLAVRLFANMFAGHMVLATILIFIYVARNHSLWAIITVGSVLGIVALSLLEIFVAFLQAYIFVFLTALFMGMAMHPEH